MATMIFANSIINKKPLKIFNYGKMSRSFTFIDDVILVLTKLIKNPSISDKFFDKNNPNLSTSWCPYRILNIRNDNSTELMEFIKTLEEELGIKAKKIFESMKKGDVMNTLSDNTILKEWIGIHPTTSMKNGVRIFLNWYKDY